MLIKDKINSRVIAIYQDNLSRICLFACAGLICLIIAQLPFPTFLELCACSYQMRGRKYPALYLPVHDLTSWQPFLHLRPVQSVSWR